jgi:hypothetical protein
VSDNFAFDVSAETREQFDHVMRLAFWQKREAVAYKVIPDKGFVLYWTWDEKDAPKQGITPLPYPMQWKAVADFIWGWFERTAYPKEPDHDGDNTKGWRVYNEAWGHVAGDWRAFCAVQPIWMMHGK